MRGRIGTKTLSRLFSTIKKELQRNGLMSEVFTFVDASHLISKANLWEERDKAIALKYEKLNNEVLSQSKVSSDNQALRVIISFGMDIKSMYPLICNQG